MLADYDHVYRGDLKSDREADVHNILKIKSVVGNCFVVVLFWYSLCSLCLGLYTWWYF
jgi:hypothetical protein